METRSVVTYVSYDQNGTLLEESSDQQDRIQSERKLKKEKDNTLIPESNIMPEEEEY